MKPQTTSYHFDASKKEKIRYQNAAANWSYCAGNWNKVDNEKFPEEKIIWKTNSWCLFGLMFQGTNISVTLKLMSSFSVCFPRHADTPLWETAKETNKQPPTHTHTHTHILQKGSVWHKKWVNVCNLIQVPDINKNTRKQQKDYFSLSHTRPHTLTHTSMQCDSHLGCSCPSKASLRMPSPPRWRSRNSRHLKPT